MRKFKSLTMLALSFFVVSVSYAARKTKIITIDDEIVDVSCVDSGQSCLDDIIITPKQ